MRDTTVDMLSAMGHHAMSAGDASTAMSILTSNPIDILLTDVGLPDMPGATLASHARSRFPGLNVIFAMAEGPDSDVSTFGTARTLVKPFTIEQLSAAISGAPNRRSE